MLEELTHVRHPASGGGGGAEDLGALPDGLGQDGVGLGARDPRPVPDVVVDDVALAPPEAIVFAPDQLLPARDADSGDRAAQVLW